MRRGGIWSRRWRSALWCGVCLLCLVTFAIKDALNYLLPDHEAHRNHRCPPPPVELDGCASWRPILVSHPTCACTRRLLVLHDTCADFVALDTEGHVSFMQEYFGNSTCSDQATLRGPRQHVISVSSDDMNSAELAALNATITQVSEVYKGWVLRLYTRVTPQNSAGLCSLACANHNLDLCDVRNLSQPISLSDEAGRLGWRWAVLGDPLVSAWAVRRMDRTILSREAHAVTQFINSDKCWHMMKDHASHAHDPRGSGLLGGKTSWGVTQLQHISQHLLQIKNAEEEERIVKEQLLPLMGDDAMIHDSVSCSQSSGVVPFPSRRRPGQWVGMPAPKPSQQLYQKLSQPYMARKPTNGTSKRPSQRETPAGHFAPGEKTEFIRAGVKHNASQRPRTGSPGLRQELPRKEAEINRQNGIPTCPSSCRPLLHPDWEYC
ncbi:uncharacterized protein [Panulirus ornatus]|uniref:uncharacterized protein isoform X2 n=1 Tax=Panulirus ornatus TaxID=150431 RepID=UPI003A8C5B52